MALAEADLKQIVDHVRVNLYDMLMEVAPRFSPGSLSLHEGIIRLQEELKNQRELMAAGFEAVDKRFEDINKRFEAVDKRFEDINKRFEAVDRRFEDVNNRFEDINNRFEDINKRFEAVDRRFEDLTANMNKRFEAVDKRFEDLTANMNKRFEAVDKRFEDLHKRFNGLQWMVIVGFVMIGTVLSIFGFLSVS